MKTSTRFGHKLGNQSGISSLMDDLGKALAEQGDLVMMGGGNPAHIPEIEAALAQRLQEIAHDKHLVRQFLGIYDPPKGEAAFIEALSDLFSETLSASIRPENIALTHGSQDAFFKLFNLFAGNTLESDHKRILLPIVPEYIGYADVGLEQDLFVAQAPIIKETGEHRFKYFIDFDNLQIDESIGAICISRPTNPSGNVLTDAEIQRLDECAKEKGVPLIIDGAYGLPFPAMIFNDSKPYWSDNTILCLSLSKFGMPAVRTGIVIANADIIEKLANMNAIMSLAPGSVGSVMARQLVESRDILKLSQEVIRPFYESQANAALNALDRALEGVDYKVHESEGALFLWLWLPALSMSNHDLYLKLKDSGVLVVSGHYFFPGLAQDNELMQKHRSQCLRLSFTQGIDKIQKGMSIIGETLKSI